MTLRKTLKWTFIAFLLVIAFVVSVDHALCETTDAPLDKQIIMVYMTGSDLESGHHAATDDITEMLRSRYNTDELTVLVMIGGSKKWKSFPSDKTIIYEVTGIFGPTPVYTGQLLNMGDADSLSFFLNYCFDNYKASMYSLILWDHGGGPLEGVCFDENYLLLTRMDGLTLGELESALAASPFSENNKLEWIGFDACLMSSIEVAYKCAPYAKYMIASQEVEPGSGWNYRFLKNIDHLSSGSETGKEIIDSYVTNTSTGIGIYPILTLSCMDLAKVEQIRELMDIVFGDIAGKLDMNTYSDLVRKRLQAVSIGRSSNDAENYDLVDLLGLIAAYDEDSSASKELQNLIHESITYNSSNVKGLNGLSIYFPYYNKLFFKYSWSKAYESLSASEKYLSFLKKYCAIWLSPSAQDWHSNRKVHLIANESETILSTELTDEQIKDYSSASLYILLNTGWNNATQSDGFIFVDKSTDVQLIGNTLYAKDPGTLLVLCDSDDHVLANAVEYEIVDNEYVIPIRLSNMTLAQALKNIGTDAEERTMIKANIKCSPPNQDGKLHIISITAVPDDAGTLPQGKMDVRLSDYAELSLVQQAHHMTFDQNGLLLPYEQWDRFGLDGYLIDLDEYNYEISVKIINRKDVISEDVMFDDYVYLFTISDTKNDHYSTEICSLQP